jgi:hypothetical protein
VPHQLTDTVGNKPRLVMTMSGSSETNGDEQANHRESARQTAEELRDNLEALAESDLPIAYDARQILRALDENKNPTDQ